MGEITLLHGIALLLELLHHGRHIDGVPRNDRVGDQIEAAGLMGQFLAPSAAQLAPVGDERVAGKIVRKCPLSRNSQFFSERF